MPNDVKIIVSAVALIVAAILALLERIADPPGVFDLHHGHRRLHGGGHVDFPRGRGEERRQSKAR